MREQSLRPRRGGLEHLAVPGHWRPTGTDAGETPEVPAGTVPPPAGPAADGVTAIPAGAPADPLPVKSAPPGSAGPASRPAGPDTEAVDLVPVQAPPQALRQRPRGRRLARPWLTWLVALLLAAAVMVAAGFVAGSIIRGLLPEADGAAAPAGTGEDGAAAGADGGEAVAADGMSVTVVEPEDLPESWLGSELAPGRSAGSAYRWVDGNGTTTLVLSIGTGEQGRLDASGAPAGAGTLYVTSILGEGEDAVVQRQMREPVLCDGGSAAFRDGSVRVSDADGDGVGEVTTGWTVECPGDPDDSADKLSLLEGPDKYILRGSAGTGAGDPDPEPSADRWPAGALDAAVALYGEVFRG